MPPTDIDIKFLILRIPEYVISALLEKRYVIGNLFGVYIDYVYFNGKFLVELPGGIPLKSNDFLVI